MSHIGSILKRKIMWGNILFFSLVTLLGFVAAPVYIGLAGISLSELLLFFFYLAVTSFSITLGYHRLFAHTTFKANAFVRFLALFFGAAALEQSALEWSSHHRDHHRYVDTDRDPYNIKKGFWHAHIGWLIFWRHQFHFENVKDLAKSRLMMHQHKFYALWAAGAGVLLPIIIGALTGHILGAVLLSVFARLALVYHATWCINSVCHTFGKATYDIDSSAKDHWFAALITNGEGYHNYHHYFPGDYRNGVRWYQWDPTKWVIALLAKMGWAWDLKTVSRFHILAARLAAENQRMAARLETIEPHHSVTLKTLLQTQYDRLKQTLSDWEHSAREYQDVLRRQIARYSEAHKQAAFKHEEARRRFQESLAVWKSIHLLNLPF